MTASAPMAPTTPGVRSWWGIPFATAERYRRPVVADFDPDRPYDRKGVVSVQPDSGDWLGGRFGCGDDDVDPTGARHLLGSRAGQQGRRHQVGWRRLFGVRQLTA